MINIDRHTFIYYTSLAKDMSKELDSDNGVSFSVTIDAEKPNEDDWERSEMRLSPSKINMYLKCPRSFYYRYIAKLPETMTIHLFRGTIVHNILEDLFKKKFKYASYWRHGAAKEWVTAEFTREWNNLVDTKPWVFKDYPEAQFRKETLDMLINYCDRIENKLYDMLEWKVYRSKDQAFKNLRPLETEMRLHNKDLKIMGIIDGVTKDFEGNISLIDYKTSKRYGPWLPEDYYRQLIIYALLYYEHTGIVPKFAGIDWLRFDETYFVKITDSELAEARKVIKDMHTALIENDNKEENFVKIPSNLCKWCSFYKNPCDVDLKVLKKKKVKK